MASNVHTDLHCEHIQLLIYCIAMFCALGVALSVHDEWFQWFASDLLHVSGSTKQLLKTLEVDYSHRCSVQGMFSMDTSSCYMFQELQQFVSAC